jgi:hypothetical protein
MDMAASARMIRYTVAGIELEPAGYAHRQANEESANYNKGASPDA